MFKKINNLHNILNNINLKIESLKIFKISSELKRLELAEKSNSDKWSNEPDDISNTDRWMSHVANELAKKLNLYYPAFIGASLRSLSARGAYAWSASDEEGNSVIFKIINGREVVKYKKIMELKKSTNNPILPNIYLASTFEEIKYKPPASSVISNEMNGVVIMEELEAMPIDLSMLITGNFINDSNNLRILASNKESLQVLCNDLSVYFSQKIYKDIVNNFDYNYEDKKSFSEIEDFAKEKSLIAKEEIHKFIYIKFRKDVYFESKKFNNVISIYTWVINIIRDFINQFFENNKDIKISNVMDLKRSTSEYIIDKLKVYSHHSNYKYNIPGAIEFNKNIEKLRDMKVFPADLSADNVMLRPDTKEIVISDVGHFYFN
jgi:hypothetical protein